MDRDLGVTETRRSRRRAWYEQRRRASTRVRALLAGALVLGFGVTATLAAWTDQENATADITAGTFAVESRASMEVGATPYADRSTNAVTVTFPGGNLYPGQSHAGWVQIKNTGSVPGSVKLSHETFTTNGIAGVDLATGLSVRIVPSIGDSTIPPACTPETEGGTPRPLEAISADEASLPLGASEGNSANYCIILTLAENSPNTAQGGTVTPTWTFTATTDQ